MNTSDRGIKLIEQFEGLRLHAYKALASEKYWTIGYGHYGADVKADQTITQEQAEAYLRSDLGIAEAAVRTYVDAFTPNQNQFDALVSFSYNCGGGNLKKLVSGRTAAEVAAAMPNYCHAGGQVLQGLVRRRAAEVELFNEEVENEVTKTEKAVTWAIGIANDDSHGYDQGANRWKQDYDCSALVIQAWEQAGAPVRTAGATYTGNMKRIFLANGFADVTKSVNLATGAGLQRGDVLLKEAHHTAMSIGSGQIVQASINEKGTTTGGQVGDQTGREIWTRSYYNYTGGWDCVLRYTGDQTVAGKTVDELAQEVLAGKWGTGDAKKQALTAAGYDYKAVRAKVNALLKGGTTEVKPAVTYTPGQTYTVNVSLNVRTGPGTSYRKKKHSELTVSGQQADSTHTGVMDPGTKVTCKETQMDGENIWMRTPSGWLAAYYNGNKYIS